MIPHPVIKASLEVCSVGAIVSYWLGYLPGIAAVFATLASGAYYAMQAYYLYKEKNKD